jgi:lipopolysaccharide export system permease protein
VKVFVMSLVSITGILLMAGIVAEASQQGLSPAQILQAIPLLIPSTLPYTIPATTLFATCIVYGRLAADNEILAIKSAGIGIGKVVWPGLLLGITMSVATMGLYYRIIPYTHHLLRAMVFDDAEELLYSVLRKNLCLAAPNQPYAMWVKGVEGKKLVIPTLKHRDAKGEYDVVVSAKEAYLRVDMAKKEMRILMKDGVVSSDGGDQGYFDERLFEAPLPNNFGAETIRRARDMTWQEMTEARVKLVNEIADHAAEIARRSEDAKTSPELAAHLKELGKTNKFLHQQVTLLDVERQMRPALSIGCFFFIFVGCPVGIWFSKSDYLSSFVTCFLPIIIIYYPLTLCGTGMAKDGKYNLELLIWGPNILMGIIGLALFWRLRKN